MTYTMRRRTIVHRAAIILFGAAALACEPADTTVQDPVPMPDPSPVEYPVALWDSRVQGETEILVHVNELGDVDSALVATTSGHAEFDSAAVKGARRLRFTPGKRGDRHVAMWTRIPIRFSQDSAATIGAATASGPRDE